MVSDAVRHLYNRAWWVLLVRGLIALALGIFIITHPLPSLEAFALVVAIWSLVSEIAQVVSAIEMRNLLSHWWLLLIGGIISIGFAIVGGVVQISDGVSLAAAKARLAHAASDPARV